MATRRVLLAVMALVFLSTAPAGAGELRCRVLGEGLKEPTAMALDHRGLVYVADSESGCVYCLAPAGHPIPLARITGVIALAVDRKRNVYAATTDGCIYRIGPDGARTELGRGLGRIADLCVDRDSGLLVLYADTGRVVRMENAGR